MCDSAHFLCEFAHFLPDFSHFFEIFLLLFTFFKSSTNLLFVIFSKYSIPIYERKQLNHLFLLQPFRKVVQQLVVETIYGKKSWRRFYFLRRRLKKTCWRFFCVWEKESFRKNKGFWFNLSSRIVVIVVRAYLAYWYTSSSYDNEAQNSLSFVVIFLLFLTTNDKGKRGPLS